MPPCLKLIPFFKVRVFIFWNFHILLWEFHIYIIFPSVFSIQLLCCPTHSFLHSWPSFYFFIIIGTYTHTTKHTQIYKYKWMGWWVHFHSVFRAGFLGLDNDMSLEKTGSSSLHSHSLPRVLHPGMEPWDIAPSKLTGQLVLSFFKACLATVLLRFPVYSAPVKCLTSGILVLQLLQPFCPFSEMFPEP